MKYDVKIVKKTRQISKYVGFILYFILIFRISIKRIYSIPYYIDYLLIVSIKFFQKYINFTKRHNKEIIIIYY